MTMCALLVIVDSDQTCLTFNQAKDELVKTSENITAPQIADQQHMSQLKAMTRASQSLVISLAFLALTCLPRTRPSFILQCLFSPDFFAPLPLNLVIANFDANTFILNKICPDFSKPTSSSRIHRDYTTNCCRLCAYNRAERAVPLGSTLSAFLHDNM
jgi:hypothetical protein